MEKKAVLIRSKIEILNSCTDWTENKTEVKKHLYILFIFYNIGKESVLIRSKNKLSKTNKKSKKHDK